MSGDRSMLRGWKLTILVLLIFFAAVGGWRLWRDAKNANRLEKLSALLEADLEAYESQTWPRPPAFGPPVKGASLDYLVQADAAKGGMSLPLFAIDYTEAELSGDEALPPRVVTSLVSMQPAVRQLLLAARAEERGASRILRASWDDSAPTHPITLFLRANDLLKLDAIRQAQSGNPAAAVDRLLALDRLGRDAELGGTILPYLVCISMTAAATRTAGDLAGQGRLDARSLDRVRAWARERELSRTDWAEVLSAENLMVQVLLEKCARGEPELLFTLDKQFRGDPFDRIPWYEKMLLSDTSPVLDLWEDIRDVAPRVERAAVEGPAAAAAEWKAIQASAGESATAVIAGQLATLLQRVVDQEIELCLRLRALLLGLDVLAFHDRHGRWPASLDDLDPPDPEGRKWVYLLDPETGKPSIDLDPPFDTDPEDSVPLFRIR